jgi:hypothetical protein
MVLSKTIFNKLLFLKLVVTSTDVMFVGRMGEWDDEDSGHNIPNVRHH